MFMRVSYPTDLSENSKRAIRCINALKPDTVHVMDEDTFDIKNHLIDEAKSAEIEVLIGEPWIEIVKRSENYDLIVLGAFGRGGILKRLLGSTAEAVLRHSKCSVLVVR